VILNRSCVVTRDFSGLVVSSPAGSRWRDSMALHQEPAPGTTIAPV